MQLPFALLTLAALVLTAGNSWGQVPGNVWHFPRNTEPAGVAGMRNPPYGILTNTAVTLYNGSYAPEGNQSAGQVWYRARGSGLGFATANLTFDTQAGDNKYWRATLPSSFAVGDTVEYFFE